MTPKVENDVRLHPTIRYVVVLTLATITLNSNAIAGMPLFTDDPGTPGPNHWEINIAATSDKTATEWRFEAPLLDLNYGVGDHIELTYEVPMSILAANGAAIHAGMGNSLVGVKWRFLDQDKAWLDVSMYPQFEFNSDTSSVCRGLAEAGWSLLLPMEVGHKFGPLTVYSEAGLCLNQQRPNEWLCGLAAEYELNEKFSLMGELHAGCEERFQNNQVVANIGCRWEISKKVSILTSVGRTVYSNTSDGSRFLSYMGLQFNL